MTTSVSRRELGVTALFGWVLALAWAIEGNVLATVLVLVGALFETFLWWLYPRVVVRADGER